MIQTEDMDKTKEHSLLREIDLIASAKIVFSEHVLLAKFLAVGTVVGLVVALCTPKAFTSDVVLAPELSAGGLGVSGSLADMAASFGIDLGNTSKSMDAIYPEIYPEILSSYDFLSKLFTVPVRLKDDNTERTYIDHLKLDTKTPFWQYPKIWLNNMLKPKDTYGADGGEPDPFRMSRDDFELCKSISKSIGCLIDKKTSVITITVTDQDPLVAAIIVDTLQQRLQNYITDYRTKKARIDYDYYSKLHAEAKAKYQAAQTAYADFCDVNKNIQLERFIAKRDELENDMQTAFTLMNQMTIQMQSAMARVQERTPAYTIIRSAKMPYRASSTPRFVILLFTIFLFGVADAMWVLYVRDFWRKRKEQKAEAKQTQEEI